MTISETQRQTLLSMVEDVAGPEVKKVAIVLLDSEEETTDEIIAEEEAGTSRAADMVQAKASRMSKKRKK